MNWVDAWIFQTVGDVDLFLLNVKQRMRDQFVQNWNDRLNNSTRATFYRSIIKFCFQPYLNILNFKKFSIALSRLRMSSHRLCVETGRWHQPRAIPYDDRKCSECNVLEDKFHFVLQCNRYINLRKQFISPYYWRHPNMIKFIALMNSDNDTIIKRLECYIEKAFNVRNSTIFTQRN